VTRLLSQTVRYCTVGEKSPVVIESISTAVMLNLNVNINAP